METKEDMLKRFRARRRRRSSPEVRAKRRAAGKTKVSDRKKAD